MFAIFLLQNVGAEIKAFFRKPNKTNSFFYQNVGLSTEQSLVISYISYIMVICPSTVCFKSTLPSCTKVHIHKLWSLFNPHPAFLGN